MQRNTRTRRGFDARWSPFLILLLGAVGIAIVLVSRQARRKSVAQAPVRTAPHRVAAKPDVIVAAKPVRTRRRFTAGEMLGTAVGLLVVVSLAVLGSGGTFAYLNSATTVPTMNVTAGNAALASSGSAWAMTGFYPGVTNRSAFTVTNNGTVSLALQLNSLSSPSTSGESAAGVALAQSLNVSVYVAGTSASCTDGSASSSGGWSGSLGSTGGSIGSTIAPKASAIVCVAVTLPTSAPSSAQSGLTNSFTATIGGNQA
jgi:hypothetical protein